jgi:hypothetical protein
MPCAAKNRRVGDMTLDELRTLVRDTVLELVDPDAGLTLRPEVVGSLKQTLRQKARGEGVPLGEVKKRLGLK